MKSVLQLLILVLALSSRRLVAQDVIENGGEVSESDRIKEPRGDLESPHEMGRRGGGQRQGQQQREGDARQARPGWKPPPSKLQGEGQEETETEEAPNTASASGEGQGQGEVGKEVDEATDPGLVPMPDLPVPPETEGKSNGDTDTGTGDVAATADDTQEELVPLVSTERNADAAAAATTDSGVVPVQTEAGEGEGVVEGDVVENAVVAVEVEVEEEELYQGLQAEVEAEEKLAEEEVVEVEVEVDGLAPAAAAAGSGGGGIDEGESSTSTSTSTDASPLLERISALEQQKTQLEGSIRAALDAAAANRESFEVQAQLVGACEGRAAALTTQRDQLVGRVHELEQMRGQDQDMGNNDKGVSDQSGSEKGCPPCAAPVPVRVGVCDVDVCQEQIAHAAADIVSKANAAALDHSLTASSFLIGILRIVGNYMWVEAGPRIWVFLVFILLFTWTKLGLLWSSWIAPFFAAIWQPIYGLNSEMFDKIGGAIYDAYAVYIVPFLFPAWHFCRNKAHALAYFSHKNVFVPTCDWVLDKHALLAALLASQLGSYAAVQVIFASYNDQLALANLILFLVVAIPLCMWKFKRFGKAVIYLITLPLRMVWWGWKSMMLLKEAIKIMYALYKKEEEERIAREAEVERALQDVAMLSAPATGFGYPNPRASPQYASAGGHYPSNI